ncbi:right-handed parallel beta-helix repeat-containing protein [Kitasatospora sp. MMS16-BH015]|uniref:right-handed parallel beta-helix repeat-containing protein n=1 Tax=Kitasatospora sp. MMS16-BH015 TaxID=2018025 RepID=UPI000CF2D070|nr:right-handed parallel beta-helix repeat-containing protein [Kitasatospora sp. MMS16-BH015]
MRRRRKLAAAIVVAASTGLAGAAGTLPALAVSTGTLYVDNSAGNCADHGPGSQAQPFCTVQAGVDAAQPGWTVSVGFGKGEYPEQVTVHSSGAAGRPIVVKGQKKRGDAPVVGVISGLATPATAHGFLLDGVHDVTVQGFYLSQTAAEAVLVKDSSGVTVDSNEIVIAGWGNNAQGSAKAVPGGNPAIRLTGSSSGVTVSRNAVGGGEGGGIAVDAGVTGTVITTNAVTAAGRATEGVGYGIGVTDAPGTVVTGNTVASSGAAGIALLGHSDHAVVENNVVADSYSRSSAAEAAELSVSPEAATGTKSDYNSVYPTGKGAAYRWAGTAYQQPGDLKGATGQGSHDLREAPKFLLDGSANSSVTPTAASGATDSADADAPGELTTDLYGHPRVDDPQVDNTGAGAVGYHDRGAVELAAFSRLSLDFTPYKGPYPLAVTVTATAERNWPLATTYTYDFGDGSGLQTSTEARVQHVYQKPGSYLISVTASGADPNTAISTTGMVPLTVDEPGDLVPDLRVSKDDRQNGGGPLGYVADLSRSTSPWYFSGYQVDFGDGSPVEQNNNFLHHTYQRPGDYTVTATLKDQGGRTATAQQTVHVGYGQLGFTPIAPQRVLDTRLPGMTGNSRRLGPGESITVYVPTAPGHPHGDAAVLNVTAVNPSQSGYLSVYPAGTDRPATSNVNFTAGQTVPNLVTVPTGQGDAVTVYNFSGSTDVVVDAMGYYQADTGSRFTPLAPARLLDTRATSPVGPDGTTSIQVRGNAGVPADATAAVLNLTSTDSDAGGYLTAYASGTARPGTSNLNFGPRQTVANQVVVPIGADGKVTVYNHTGHTHVVADVFGYYSPSGSLFTPVPPTRLVDTRQSSALGAGSVLKVDTGLPAGATGAVLNVTDTASTAAGYLTVWADGAARPGTSNVNFAAGKTVPNHVTTPLGANGAFDVYNFTGRSQVVADLFGYFAK